jgi:DNA-binding IclR family transcriptional regulator
VVIASIGISAPQSRFPKSLYAVRGTQVTDIAHAISASIRV